MVGGLLVKPYFLAGRATRISGNGARAVARGSMRAAAWTTQRVACAVRLLNPLAWRLSGRGRLERRILETSAAVERRIGQDIHDGIGQVLVGVALLSRALERELAAKLPDRAADAAQIAQIAEDGMARTRELARVLRSAEIDAEGLPAALGKMASDCGKAFGVTCTFEHDASVRIEDESAATHVYRIAQEAVTNAARHGRAKRVVIKLGTEGRTASLTVRDDGTGFAAGEAPAGDTKGLGLRIMECRAKAVGGTLSIGRGPSGGTVVTCTFPARGKRK